MRGKIFGNLPQDARNYDESDWLVYGDDPQPNTRAKLIALTIEEMATRGPGGFSVNSVCDRIDAKHALVNYYFGNKEMLIAEASAVSYKKSVNDAHNRILMAPKDPEKRLRAHIDGELAWYRQMKSWALLVNYPIASDLSRKLIEENFGAELRKYFEFYLSLVGTMILDIRRGTTSEFDFDVTNYPREFLLKHPAIVLDGISMIWSAHGLHIWSAGQQVGSATLSAEQFTQKMAIDHHIKRMISLARGK